MNKATWRDDYKLGPWRSVVGHRRLEDWGKMIKPERLTVKKVLERLDNSHLFGFLCLAGGFLMIILIAAVVEAW